jgi:hypothetical protein
MLHSLKLGRPLLAAAAIFWGVAFGAPANANEILITPQNGSDPVTISSGDATDQNFVGLVDGFGDQFLAGTFSFSAATGFAPFAGNEAEEAQVLTSECDCGVTFVAIDGSKQENPPLSFEIAGEFFSIKQDGWIAFFHNVAGEAITVTTSVLVSHSTQFVPGPIVGAGLPGLLLACGGLLALARRRRQQIA